MICAPYRSPTRARNRRGRLRRPLAIVAAATSMSLLLVLAAKANDAVRHKGPEPFAACHWDADSGLPNPLIVNGFATGSARVPSDQETEIVNYARNDLRDVQEVCVVGQADRRGSSDDNDHLAMRRARAVAARLIGAGVNPASVTLSSRADAFGDVGPKWLWFSGSRRVEIIAIR